MNEVAEDGLDPGDWPAWFDGRELLARDVAIPARSAWALHGESVFETVAAVDGRLGFPGEHRERLLRALREVFDVAAHEPVDEALRAAAALAVRLAEDPARSRVALRVTLARAAAGGWHRLVQARPLRRFEGSSGITLVAPHGSLSAVALGGPSGYKHGSRLAHRLARREAIAVGAFDALRLGTSGLPVCGTIGNVLVRTSRDVATPPVADGALPGIARAALLATRSLELGAAGRLPLVERRIERYEWASAEAVWLCGSVLGVAPVTSIAGLGGAGCPDPLELPGSAGEPLEALRAAFSSAERASGPSFA